MQMMTLLERDVWMARHLERVSRSFAFCIAKLETPLRHQVGLSYLICRILDSIEDSAWVDRGALEAQYSQRQAFEGFISFLKTQPNDAAILEWSERLLRDAVMPEGEQVLVREAHMVFGLYWQERPRVREVMSGPIESMARGMLEFHGKPEFRGLKLSSLQEVNRYCFFVAGVVGEILTGLVRLIGEDRGMKVASSLVEGFRFGLFLQKVNLLKDRETDLKEGRDLVPSRLAVFRSAFEDARQAFSYLTSVPVALEGYRLFCGWSLFLGLASLPHIAGRKKIGRLETVALLAAVERRVRSNVELEVLFLKYLRKAETACERLVEPTKMSAVDVSKGEELLKYRRNYVGLAKDEELCAIIANGSSR